MNRTAKQILKVYVLLLSQLPWQLGYTDSLEPLTNGSLEAVKADNFEPLTVDTFAEIKAHYQGKPFLLSLWSIDCAPCRLELKMLGELKKKDPSFPLVLISADSLEQRETALYILEEYSLEKPVSWMFADNFSEPLRYSIDSNWYGELPRSYLFDSSHNAIAHSGVLTEKQLTLFLSTISQ
jgi:thiol-disulfide isomerase/thioredoxin